MDALNKRLDDRYLWDPIPFEVSKWAENLSCFRSTADQQRHEDTRDVRIINAFLCASERSTSRKEDEVTILALLAGFDDHQIRRLLNQPPSDPNSSEISRRSVEFLNLLGKMPKQLLLTASPRCPQSSRRACPIDLLEAWRHTPGGPEFSEFYDLNDLGVQGSWEGYWLRSGSGARFDIADWRGDSTIMAAKDFPVDKAKPKTAYAFPMQDVAEGVWRKWECSRTSCLRMWSRPALARN